MLEHAYHWERAQPDRIYLTQPMGEGEVRDFTWREVLDQARRMAAHLRSLGYPPGSNLAIIGKNSAHWLICDLAIWMAGHVSVPIYPTLNAASVKQILDHCEAKLVFLGKLDVWEAMKPGVGDALPIIRLPLAPPSRGDEWDDIIHSTKALDESPTRGADELATIVYTSGSTGVPKGVMMSFGCIMRASLSGLTAAGGNGLQLSPEDRLLSYLPLAHVYERIVIESAGLILGCHIYFVEKLDTFLEDLRRARPTLFHSVPRLWQQFYLGVSSKVPPQRLDTLLKIPLVGWFLKRKILQGLGLDHARVALSGSAPIAAELISWYRRLGLELLEGYGMTEDCACSHAGLKGKIRPGYVGNTLPGVQAKLSEEGEVLVKSPGAMMGYYKQPELTVECYTPDGFFRTGDRGEYDPDGRLRITGRVKELFKTSKGKYVAPAPIENLLLQHPRIEAACVSGLGHPQPHALVMLAPDARQRMTSTDGRAELERELESLLQKVNGQVNNFEALAFITVVFEVWTIENGFLTPTMKLRRARLDETYAVHAGGWYAQQRRVIWHDTTTR
jgi:long-subunit acyl-CoA synthetase (AMP-forming)